MDSFEFNPRAQKDLGYSSYPNVWDFFAFALIIGVLTAFAKAFGDIAYLPSSELRGIDLSISALPWYALYSVARMFLALLLSLLVALVVGTLAARSRIAEKIIIPAVDVLQSLPILGYLTLAATVFMHHASQPGIGVEAVAIFAIFTSQVWNMILSVYQNLRMLPVSMQEAAAMLQLSRLQKFWRIDVPFATPDLVMNMMISLSAGWFYVVESEAVPLAESGDARYLLPGIGSYIWQAQATGDSFAMFAACVAMFLVILAYDQLIFRPLSHVVRAYQADDESYERSWLVSMFMRTRWCRALVAWAGHGMARLFLWMNRFSRRYDYRESVRLGKKGDEGVVENLLIGGVTLVCLGSAVIYLLQMVPFELLLQVVFYGFCTALRVFAMLLLATVIWLPVGVWIGFRPKIAGFVDPVVQFMAAFPPNLLYPVMMQLILYYQLDINVWCAPLMILGTQWYILVNVIAGVRSLPKHLLYVAKNLQLSRLSMWKHLIFPSVAPHLVSGALAAAGGAWNASIVAEVISWSHQRVYAVGIGAFIAEHVGQVDLQILGIMVMSAYVILINGLFWYPLFRWVTKSYAWDGV